MSEQRRIRVSVARDGAVSAETLGILGPECLDQVSVLEGLLDAVATDSTLTQDYHRSEVNTGQAVTESERRQS